MSCLVLMILFILAVVVSSTWGAVVPAGRVSLPVDGMEIVTTYLFGEEDDIKALRLDIGTSSGFIELSTNGVGLSIEFIRRPTNSNPLFKFCTEVLPAAVADFLLKKSRIPIEEIQMISVGNASNTPLVACKCYVGLMIRMGFTYIDKQIVDNADSFCRNNPHERGIIFARSSRDSKKLIPEVSPIGSLFVGLAKSYTRFRNEAEDV